MQMYLPALATKDEKAVSRPIAQLALEPPPSGRIKSINWYFSAHFRAESFTSQPACFSAGSINFRLVVASVGPVISSLLLHKVGNRRDDPILADDEALA